MFKKNVGKVKNQKLVTQLYLASFSKMLLKAMEKDPCRTVQDLYDEVILILENDGFDMSRLDDLNGL